SVRTRAANKSALFLRLRGARGSKLCDDFLTETTDVINHLLTLAGKTRHHVSRTEVRKAPVVIGGACRHLHDMNFEIGSGEGSVLFAQCMELTDHGFESVGICIRRDPPVAQAGGSGQSGLAVAAIQNWYGTVGDRVQFDRPDVIVFTVKFE